MNVFLLAFANPPSRQKSFLRPCHCECPLPVKLPTTAAAARRRRSQTEYGLCGHLRACEPGHLPGAPEPVSVDAIPSQQAPQSSGAGTSPNKPPKRNHRRTACLRSSCTAHGSFNQASPASGAANLCAWHLAAYAAAMVDLAGPRTMQRLERYTGSEHVLRYWDPTISGFPCQSSCTSCRALRMLQVTTAQQATMAEDHISSSAPRFSADTRSGMAQIK